MNSLARRALILSVAAALCSCHASFSDIMARYGGTTPCCTHFREFTYRKITYGTKLRFDIGFESPLFPFPDGRSYFAAFELPPFSAPYVITLKSFMNGDHIDRGHIFYPRVLLLDDGFNIIGTPDSETLRLARTALFGETWGLPLKYERTVSIGVRNARYIVITTTAAHLKETVLHETAELRPGVSGGMVVPKITGSRTVPLPHSPVGSFELIMPEAAPHQDMLPK